MKYAGLEKKAKDIDKALKAEQGRVKSNLKRSQAKHIQYYAKLLQLNKDFKQS